MQTGGVFVQTNQISQLTGRASQILKDGSQVLVRVIGEKGNGQYEGSVAGVRVNIQSAKALVPGQTFLASISAKNGTVFITPKETTLFSQSGVQINALQNEQIVAILSQLGLPQDKISEHLFHQFKQLGLKMDSQLMNKIRGLSLKFGGNQKKVAELLSILKEKGIEATSVELSELLTELDLDERNENKQFRMINRVNEKKGKWYLLPFEISQENSVLGVGNIRIMLENEHLLKYVNIECLYNSQQYLFSLQFENKQLKIIRFNVSENVNDKSENSSDFNHKKNEYIKKLNAKINDILKDEKNIKIEWVSSDLIEGTSCGLETYESVGGSV